MHCQKYLLLQYHIIIKVYFFRNLTLFLLVLNSEAKLRNRETMESFVTSIKMKGIQLMVIKIKHLAIKKNKIKSTN